MNKDDKETMDVLVRNQAKLIGAFETLNSNLAKALKRIGELEDQMEILIYLPSLKREIQMMIEMRAAKRNSRTTSFTFDFGTTFNPGGGYNTGTYNFKPSPLPKKEKHWEILELEPGSTKDEIKKSFNRKVFSCHPDTGGNPEKYRELVAARDAALKQAV